MKRVALLAVVVAVAAVGRPGSARASARAFIPCSADGTVSVIDTSTDTVTATVKFPTTEKMPTTVPLDVDSQQATDCGLSTS